MKIQFWMKRPVTVKPRDSVLAARHLMEEHRFNQLPVVVDGRLVGVVTDRDLRDAFPSVLDVLRRRRGHASGADPAAIAVEDVMSRNVLSLDPDGLVVDAARLMRRERIGAVPVVDHGRLVGILTRSDVLDAFVEVAGPATS
jgi:acetoin utilization protein AcuB